MQRDRYSKIRYEIENFFGGGIKIRKKIISEREEILKMVNDEIITAELVEHVHTFFREATKKYYDVEIMHMIEDALMINFIQQVAQEKIPNTEIKSIAEKISAFNSEKYYKWYA